jgi:Flp pilus assembly protein TadB
MTLEAGWAVQAGLGLAGLGLGAAAWQALPGPRPISWWSRRRDRWRWARAAVDWVWRRVTMQQTRELAAILGLGPLGALGTILILAGGLGLVAWGLFGIPWPVVLAGVAGAVAVLPNGQIRRRYARWQRQVVAGLPTFLHHLQILLDLGLPLPDALRRARQRVRGPLGPELDHVMARLERGDLLGDAFQDLVRRTRSMEVMVLATTLATSAGRRLTAQALAPLMTMLAAIQIREQERQTSAVDQVASMVPVLATFGGMITVLYLLLAQALQGGTAVL